MSYLLIYFYVKVYYVCTFESTHQASEQLCKFYLLNDLYNEYTILS